MRKPVLILLSMCIFICASVVAKAQTHNDSVLVRYYQAITPKAKAKETLQEELESTVRVFEIEKLGALYVQKNTAEAKAVKPGRYAISSYMFRSDVMRPLLVKFDYYPEDGRRPFPVIVGFERGNVSIRSKISGNSTGMIFSITAISDKFKLQLEVSFGESMVPYVSKVHGYYLKSSLLKPIPLAQNQLLISRFSLLKQDTGSIFIDQRWALNRRRSHSKNIEKLKLTIHNELSYGQSTVPQAEPKKCSSLGILGFTRKY